MIAASAWAAPVVAVVDAPLGPGRASAVEVAGDRAPAASANGAVLSAFVEVRPGVWRAELVPSPDSRAVELAIGEARLRAEVTDPAPGALATPQAVVTANVGDPVILPLSGFTGDLADLELGASGGQVRAIRTADGVAIELVPDDLTYPRWLLVGARDRRSDAAPLVVRVRLRARPRLPLRAEPGTRLELQVGARVYGPFVADAEGDLEGRIEQYAGERSALAILHDELGNETRTEIPLVADAVPALLVVRGTDQLPGRPPPLLHVATVGPSGEPTAAPTCQAAVGELPLHRVGPDLWTVAIPAVPAPQDLRVICTLGSRQATARVPVAAAVPARLGLRVWPEELRADFPEAEVRAVLEDWRGDRLSTEPVRVSAARGRVDWRAAEGFGDYDGGAAVAVGEDTLEARYDAPPGDGPVVELAIAWTPDGDGRIVHGRALDARRRPLAGVSVRLRAGDATAEATTGADGWASARFDGASDAALAVSAAGRTRAAVAPAGSALPGPGSDLVARAGVSIRPGRAAGLDVTVEPSPLRAGPGAVAFVTVKVEDGLGRPVTDEPVAVAASEGEVGDLRLREDGTFVAEFSPDPGGRARDVEITASTSSVHTSTHLALVPRTVRYALGPWAGLASDPGGGLSPVGGIDLDVRLRSRLVGEALMVRLGGAVRTFSDRVPTGVGPAAELRSTLVPLSLAVLFRDDRGDWSLWAGGGLAAGAHRLSVSFGGAEVTRGTAPLVGAEAHAAVARRAFGGELALSARGSFLPATDEDVGYDGNLGGLWLGLGYRFVW